LDEQELVAAVKDFERVVKLSQRLSRTGNRSVAVLCLFYAMRSAFAIRAIFGDQGGVVRTNSSSAEYRSVSWEDLPSLGPVQNATPKLIAAASLDDSAGMATALEEMGVLALCPMPQEQLSRMEVLAGNVTGRARLIPLVELSVLAAELGDYGKASKYVVESRTFDPSSCDLYNLCVVEGLIALNAGKIRDAVQHLDKSLVACRTDEYASLSCGVRAPNLALVQKLLERGERVEVLRHLSDCKDVWQVFRPQIDKWINLIEGGEIPNFQASRGVKAWNRASQKLAMQWLRVCSLGEVHDPPNPKSPAEVMAGRERLRAEYNMSAAIRKKLENL
jgi:hypothetical protein